MPRARVRVPGRTQKKRQCRVRWGETGRSIASKTPPPLCPGGAVVQGALRKVAASLSAAARGVSDTLPSSRAKCSLRGALRGGSAAPGSAGIGRQAKQNRAKAPPCFPLVSLSGRRCGRGSLARGGPRPCPPPHAAFRTLCPQAGQSVRSEAHYAAAVPRRARPASGGGPGKAGRSAALPCRAALSAPFFRPHFPGLPRLRPADPRGPLRAPRAKTGKIRLFCDISAFVNRICF